MTFNLHEAALKALPDAAKLMELDIRRSALEHGWHPDVVNNITVEHGEEGFKVNVPHTHADAAFIHEYGSESKQPTAVIRKYGNTGAAHAAYRSLAHHLGSVL